MTTPTNHERLRKDLGLLDVYAVAVGTTLSSGFFLLPGLAFSEAGPDVVLAYALAGLLVVPALLSMVELSTAMPRAGGAYYFVDRSMGPLAGTVGGIGTWLVLVLKTAFVLIGMGAYLGYLWPSLPITPLAAVLALGFGGVNLVGAKEAGTFQRVLVGGLLLLLVWFTVHGGLYAEAERFSALLQSGRGGLLATTGLVYISYAGLTKITSIAEEVDDPERNLPLGMFLALLTAVTVYVAGALVMVGVTPPDVLSGTLVPALEAAVRFSGPWAAAIVVGAAVLAFLAAANAGILSASRYPLAMGRDHLLPQVLTRLNDRDVPGISVQVTTAAVVAIIVAVDPLEIAKLASAFQLLMFALMCVAVIIMRESGLLSYDPGYRSPGYPWMQLAGAVTSVWMVFELGWLSVAFSTGMVAASVAWYWFYAGQEVVREGAIYHLFARLGRHRYDPLDRELRQILKEKGIRDEDPYDQLILEAGVIEETEPRSFEELTARATRRFSDALPMDEEEITERFLEGARTGSTPVTRGVALPHFRSEAVDAPKLVIVRSRPGTPIEIDGTREDGAPGDERTIVHALLYLASPEEPPSRHLRILAQLAERLDRDRFIEQWLACERGRDLKRMLLHLEERPSKTAG